MGYVPIVPRPPDSPHVRDLGERLKSVIREFRHQHAMSDGEVRQALRLARSDTTKDTAGLAVALASGIALLVVIGLFALYLSQTRPDVGDVTAIPAVLVGIVVIVGLIAYLRSR